MGKLLTWEEAEAEYERLRAEARAAGKTIVLLPFIPFDLATMPRRPGRPSSNPPPTQRS
jgi:hypothetical protein